MTQINHSTIVQLLFCAPPRLNFASLVTELETALDQASAGRCDVDWDHDDIVVFQADGCRFVLALVMQPSQEFAACLTLSVGPAEGFHERNLPILTEAACRMIINRLDLRYSPDDQRWHTVAGVIGADEIDALHEALAEADRKSGQTSPIADIAYLVPKLTQKAAVDSGEDVQIPDAEPVAFGGQDPNIRHVYPVKVSNRAAKETARSSLVPHDKFERALIRKLHAAHVDHVAEVAVEVAASRALAPEVANDRPDLPVAPGENEQVIRRVRAALYPVAEAPPRVSTPLRLAAHSMDTTLIIVALPVGAAMLTYSLLRGGNANVSGRMMAITGTLLALTQTGWTSSLSAFL
ncbi:MAG: hypothetical protein V4712_01330 [Pseudomonadota bacterium]